MIASPVPFCRFDTPRCVEALHRLHRFVCDAGQVQYSPLSISQRDSVRFKCFFLLRFSGEATLFALAQFSNQNHGCSLTANRATSVYVHKHIYVPSARDVCLFLCEQHSSSFSAVASST